MKPERLKEEIAKVEKEYQDASAQITALQQRQQQLIGAHGALQSLLVEAEAEVEALAVEEPKAEEETVSQAV